MVGPLPGATESSLLIPLPCNEWGGHVDAAGAGRRFVAIDVETTGMSPVRGDRVIEVAATIIEGTRICDEFSSLICVDCSIHPAAQKVHGIDGAMLREAPPPDDVWPRFARFISGAPLLAHNASFDLSFLRHEFSRLGQAFFNPHHCTLALSRRLLPHLPNHRLETVARHLLGGIPQDCRLHRALDDARLVALVWLEMEKRRGPG